MAFSQVFGEYAKILLNNTCNIYKLEKNVNDYGESIFSKIKIASDVNCRVNYEGESLSNNNNVYKKEYEVSIIFPVDVDIYKGCYVEVLNFENNKNIMFYACGDCVSYITHKEIKALRREVVL